MSALACSNVRSPPLQLQAETGQNFTSPRAPAALCLSERPPPLQAETEGKMSALSARLLEFAHREKGRDLARAQLVLQVRGAFPSRGGPMGFVPSSLRPAFPAPSLLSWRNCRTRLLKRPSGTPRATLLCANRWGG